MASAFATPGRAGPHGGRCNGNGMVHWRERAAGAGLGERTLIECVGVTPAGLARKQVMRHRAGRAGWGNKGGGRDM